MKLLIPSLFLPNLDYFSQLVAFDELTIHSEAKYTKQSFANRCYLKGPHQIERLIVPIQKPIAGATLSEIKIAYVEAWQLRNWRTICNCYRKSPFFEFYEPYFKQILLDNSFDRLIELNQAILTLCLHLLKLNKPISQDQDDFSSKIKLNYKHFGGYSPNFKSISYRQNFGNDFAPNLSVIDLLCCKGPESVDILNKSYVIEHL